MHPTALIAEDEPLLAQALHDELQRQWPALRLLPAVGDGEAAVAAALQHRPDVLFLDIRMPGLSGLEAAAELADAWPERQPFPALVFVTAYDQYAVQAFEAQALDYLLKPVLPARLAQTVARLQARLALPRNPHDPQHALQALLAPLRELLAAPSIQAAAATPTERLTTLPVAQGSGVRLLPVDDLLALQAADKYLRLLTRDGEHWIRTPLKELLPRLDPQVFWPIHRSTVVRASAVARVDRDDTGRLSVVLQGSGERFAVSRLHAHRFKPL